MNSIRARSQFPRLADERSTRRADERSTSARSRDLFAVPPESPLYESEVYLEKRLKLGFHTLIFTVEHLVQNKKLKFPNLKFKENF